MHHAEKNKTVIYRLNYPVSKTSLGLRPRTVFETSTKYFPSTGLPSGKKHIQFSAKVYIHLSRRNKTKFVVIMNHYNTTTFTWNVNEGMQIVIVVLYCQINSITIVILVVDCCRNKSPWVNNVHTTKMEPMHMGWSVSNDLPNYLR